MYCICCKNNNISPIDISEHLSEIEMLWEKKKVSIDGKGTTYRNVNNSMISNGIIHIINAGYGSIHDGSKIIIGICDNCITENLEDATLLYYDNYMSDSKHINDKIEISKKLYTRRKNLDDLVNKKTT